MRRWIWLLAAPTLVNVSTKPVSMVWMMSGDTTAYVVLAGSDNCIDNISGLFWYNRHIERGTRPVRDAMDAVRKICVDDQRRKK